MGLLVFLIVSQLFCASISSSVGCWIAGRLLWTKLLGRIQHSRWRHVETLHLSSELLHLLLLQLSPPAEQVEVLPLPRLNVQAHQQAVLTGSVNKVSGEVAFVCPIIGEAAAFQGDVV